MLLTGLKYIEIDKRNIKLTAPLRYKIGKYTITVPRGFVSDGASTPKILWRLFPPWDKRYTIAAIIHDYLYSEENDTGINKELADKIFDKIMQDYGVSLLKRKLMYRAVSQFGSIFFKPKLKNPGYIQKALIDHNKEAIAYYKKWNTLLEFE